MKFGKKVLVFLIVAALISSNSCITTLADTTEIGVQTEDFEGGNGLGIFVGSIGGSVSAYKEKDGNHCMYVAPYTDGVTAFAQHTLDFSGKVKLNISLDFKQKDKRVDDVCLFGLSKNGSDLVRLETKNGNIVMKKESSSIETVLVKEYAVNRYYHISVDIDYEEGFASVYVDGELKAEEQKLLQSEKPADTFYVSTKYSPGFYIDNFKIVPEQHTDRITIDGETNLNVSDKKDAQYTYTAAAYDQNGVVMKNAVSFMLLPQNEGITMKQGEDTAYLTVSKEAIGKTFTLTAQSGGVSVSKDLTVSEYVSSVSKMTMKGDARLSSSISEYPYKVTFYDQYGDVMDNEQCTFSLSGEVPEAVQLDSKTGRITVTGELPKDKHITLTATSDSNPSVKVQKKLTMLDAKTYADDVARFETLVKYVDRVREIGRDPYNGTPLIADVWDVTAQAPGEWRSGTKAGIGITSNLAFKGGWFKMLDVLYTLTGDEQYKKEITDTYQYYLDHYIDEESGLPYWGGHAAVDLKTGKGYFVNDSTYHELKNNAVYMKPFFDLDSEKAGNIVKDIICSHMVDWQALMFNRHGEYMKKTDTSYWDNWKTWKNTVQSETFGPHSCISSQALSFRSAGAEFIDLLGDLYEYNGDQGALTWAKNILDTYWRVENPETLVGGYQSSSAYDAATKTLPEDWWKPQNYSNRLAYTDYGDRFYNQFADDLVDQGFLREDEKWMAREPFLSQIDDYTITILHDLSLAKKFGLESEVGSSILEHSVKKQALFLDQAYHPDTDSLCDRVLSNGKTMEGFVVKKSGYYGGSDAIGTVYSAGVVPTSAMLAYAETYLESKDRSDLEEYRTKIYSFIRNHFMRIGLGDLGENYPGDNVQLNMDTTESEGYFCTVMTYLYRATGVTEYLDLARRIADNMISDRMVDGLFWLNSDDRFIPLGGWKAERTHYALTLLEATICGETDNLPEYVPFDAYFADYLWDDMEKGIIVDPMSIDVWFNAGIEGVDARKILLPENEIHMSVGEEKFLEITVLPKDADNTLIYNSTAPDCVFMDYSKNRLIARKKGTAQITITSSNNTAKTTLNVTVD